MLAWTNLFIPTPRLASDGSLIAFFRHANMFAPLQSNIDIHAADTRTYLFQSHLHGARANQPEITLLGSSSTRLCVCVSLLFQSDINSDEAVRRTLAHVVLQLRT